MKRVIAFLLFLCMLLPFAALADEDDQLVWELPNKAQEFTKGLRKTQTTKASQITGEDSPNQTLTRFNVWGTDLGSMTEMNGKVYMFCGDTFSSEKNADWRSNVLFIIEDDDPSDGLTITGTAPDKWGRSKECIVNSHTVTMIPTNIFSVDDTLYCIFMRVTYWGPRGGMWDCSHSGLAKSEDGGMTWVKVNQVQWPGDSNFIQTANVRVGDTMYIWGIPSGRFGGVALMKCNVHELEDPEAYSYLTGYEENGDPQWTKGKEGISQAKIIIRGPVGEISVMYNEYLGNFVMTYLHEDGGGIVMREGITPWSNWSMEYQLASSSQYAALYGGYMLPKYVEENGRVFYFAMSQYFPIYNIMWMRAEMPEK